MSVGRRFPPGGKPKVSELGDWILARGPLQRFIDWVVDYISGIPGGFKSTDPEQIQAGVTADPGTEEASWAAADHVHDVETAAPSHPTGTAASEGSGSALMRADATIQQGIVTTKGDVLGYSSVPARVPVGTNNYVLTADSSAALGVAWAPPAAASRAFVFFMSGD